jgi:hypothetical protein
MEGFKKLLAPIYSASLLSDISPDGFLNAAIKLFL